MPRGVSDSQAADVDAHAVPIPGGDWKLWRTAVLRGAGFPARLVLQLAGEEEAAAADREGAQLVGSQERLAVLGNEDQCGNNLAKHGRTSFVTPAKAGIQWPPATGWHDNIR